MAGSGSHPGPERRDGALLREETRRVLHAFLKRRLSPGQAAKPCHWGPADPHSHSRSPGEEVQRSSPRSPEEKDLGFRNQIRRLLGGRKDRDGAPTEPGRPPGSGFSLRQLLPWHPNDSQPESPGPSRPDSLPVVSCYCPNSAEPALPCLLPSFPTPTAGIPAEDPAFYSLVAEKLEAIVQEQLRSPLATLPPPESFPSEKEELLRRLVALLEEQADVINQQLQEDPVLRRVLARMSFGSFARLAELFSARHLPGGPCPGTPAPPVPSAPLAAPEPLARLALTMELTHRVSGLGGPAAGALMGHSLDHLHSFGPWLQRRGGWESLVSPVDLTLPLD
ncbi:bcl-2-like protein 12 [Tachyglossus aculeatus]|uniref:bcl-2-like protein 12 n=1 Tax=Tachyglossus aculeatus TaxID=9261 RepID=UPI0018F5E6B2|nr:bcl-2-like protein 12 [Tachyglossus aculeatus]